MSKLDDVIKGLEKKFGGGTVIRYGSFIPTKFDVIPSGILSLDNALGVGGFPRGRLVEIYGPESSGKTTITLQLIAEAQKRGLKVAFIDLENALDPNYAANLGVKMEELVVSQPNSGEEAMEIVDELVGSGEIALVVVDSVAAVMPQSELDGEMGDANVGKRAKLLNQAVRQIGLTASTNNCLVVFINQLREKIGVMYGPSETTVGGKALGYFTTIRLDIRRIGAIKDGTDIIGNRTKIKIAKNKVAPPYREVEFDLIFGSGVSKEGDLIDVAAKLDILEKKGAWFAMDGTNLAQGRDKLIAKLKEDDELREKIKELVLEKI